MKNLRTRFNRFCLRNRNKGIPNLMLAIVIGTAVVTVMSMFNGGAQLYRLLCFDKAAILKGQVWRLITFVFTENYGGFLGLIFLYFFYNLGRQVENQMGTLRFNLYYLTGILLMDAFAMIFCPTSNVVIGKYLIYYEDFIALYSQMAFFLHLSMLLTFSISNPDAQFLVFFFLPVKAWIMALIYLVMMLASIFNMTYPVNFFPHNLFPLVGLANFLLFAGKDVVNVLPPAWRMKIRSKKPKSNPKVVPFSNPGPYKTAAPKEKQNYTHRCAVCGRTDVDSPELEFRYCSRCNGYHCYCIDHINNHTHIE